MHVRLSLLLLALLTHVTLSQETPHPGAVRLPSEGYSPAYERLIQDAQIRYSDTPAWEAFRARHGDWRAIWGTWTGTPLRAYGVGCRIDGFASIDAGNIEAAARTFIAANADLLRTETVELEYMSASEYLGKWSVLFRQIHHGIPVEMSEVTLRIMPDGRVFLFGSDVFPELDIPATPAIDAGTAAVYASDGLLPPRQGTYPTEGGRLAILPVRSLQGITYHLAYEFIVSEDMEHSWVTWVDANDGRVLWRRNQVCTGVNGTVTASIKLNSILDNNTTVNVFDQNMVVGGSTVTTDSNGVYTASTSGSVVAQLRGPYVKIQRQDSADALISQSVSSGAFNVAWTGSNSTLAERTTFYSANRARNYIVKMDPAITALNYQMPCRVNVNNVCNANFDGTNLNFYKAGASGTDQCRNTAEMPDVIMHEYGHAVNSKVYIQYGKTSGMTNGALHEGTADANSGLILDRSEIGVGFFVTAGMLRDINNTQKYPKDIQNEVHYDGEIIGGAIWDMRLNIGLTRARQLAHFNRHATPDDANTGLAFTKYFLEVLAADDNDGNLSNGTPNSAGIVPAFAKHGIPGGILTIAHTAVTTANGSTAIPMTANVTTTHSSITTQNVRIWYRPRGGAWTSAAMSKTGGAQNATSNWAGSIPGQLNGTILEYYIEATEVWGTTNTYPLDGASAPLTLLVGFSTYVLYNGENATGWQMGIPGDNAITGQWENAVPVGTYSGTTPVAPSQDHSATGVRCWVTENGLSNGAVGDADVDSGRTTLESPTLTLAGLNTPVLRYYAWYTNNLGASPGLDTWTVQITSDGGSSWTGLENTKLSFNSWTPRLFVLTDSITPTNRVKLRFIAEDADPGSLVEAAVDDVEILYVQSVPVELVSFTAQRSGAHVSAAWSTASERNNAGFTVEYRIDGSDIWTTAGFVPARGGVAGASYAYDFAEQSGAPLFVRLRQQDLDGKIAHSPEVFVGVHAPAFALHQNYPDPFVGQTTLSFDLAAPAQVSVVISDVLGRELTRRDLGTQKFGAHAYTIGLDGMPSGTYLCTLIADGVRQTRIMHVNR